MNPPVYLADTDWIIDYFNQVPASVSRLREAQKQGLAISIVSLAELWEGIWYARDRPSSERHLSDFLAGVKLLEIGEETCVHFGRIRGELRRKGKLIGDLDLLIAATALEHNVTLLSNNRRHFEQIEGLRVESISG